MQLSELLDFSLTRFSQLTAALVTFCILAADSTLLLAQHDGARDSVQQIALGKFEKVDQILEKRNRLQGRPNPHSSNYCNQLLKMMLRRLRNTENKR